MTTPARKILIAMDGSKYSDYAFDWYMKYFYKERDDVLMIQVTDYFAPPVTAHGKGNLTPAAIRAAKEEEMEAANQMSILTKKIVTAGIKGNAIRLSGTKPGEAIVTASDEHKVDIIITGSRGVGKQMGSVSQYVVHNATIPVLIVRQ